MNLEDIVEQGIVVSLTKWGLEKIRDIIEEKNKNKKQKKRKSRKNNS